MKNCSKLMISSIFYFLYILKSAFGETCNPISCSRGTNTSIVNGSPIDFPARYPFRINGLQPKSCGMPGFDLYCDKSFGTLIHLSNEVVLRVEAILYYSDYLFLSDPYDCLPQKLMSLNLSETNFYPDRITQKFWVYNCSGNVNNDVYDRIDCLSGSNYTVISSGYNIIKNVAASNCTLVKILRVPVSFDSVDLSEISRIELAWNGNALPPAPKQGLDDAYNSRASTIKFVLILIGLMIAVLCTLFCCCHRFMNRDERVASTTTNTNAISNTSDDAAGLDQVTIDSYPIVVVGESGRLIKHNDHTCPICLDDYQPRETLKMLPECLHRFHADCIDQWLRSKGICPICRTSPPR